MKKGMWMLLLLLFVLASASGGLLVLAMVSAGVVQADTQMWPEGILICNAASCWYEAGGRLYECPRSSFFDARYIQPVGPGWRYESPLCTEEPCY